MIIASLGKLSAAQSLTAGTTDSTNVIQIATDGSGVDYTKFSDLWWTVDTNVAAGGAGAITVDLVIAKEAGLDNIIKILSVQVAAVTDKRVAAVGRHIVAANIGKMLINAADTDDSDYEFIGVMYVLGGTATLTADCALSPTEPHTEHHAQTVVSPVGIPGVASAGSGFVV